MSSDFERMDKIICDLRDFAHKHDSRALASTIHAKADELCDLVLVHLSDKEDPEGCGMREAAEAACEEREQKKALDDLADAGQEFDASDQMKMLDRRLKNIENQIDPEDGGMTLGAMRLALAHLLEQKAGDNLSSSGSHGFEWKEYETKAKSTAVPISPGYQTTCGGTDEES